MANKQSSLEIDRRDFLKFIYGTASAGAISGALPFWPEDAMDRPIAEPIKLVVDRYKYLVDPHFDYSSNLPTYREFLSLEGLSREALRVALEKEHWRFEWFLEDPFNWSVDEIEEWLDSDIRFDDLSPSAAADYTEYADGVRLYGSLPREEAMELSLYLVEGDCPGNDFCGVYFDGDLVELNAGLASHGINVIVA